MGYSETRKRIEHNIGAARTVDELIREKEPSNPGNDLLAMRAAYERQIKAIELEIQLEIYGELSSIAYSLRQLTPYRESNGKEAKKRR